jgi:O-antigen ligase
VSRILGLSLLLSPLLFLPWSDEAFELPKSLLLRVVALALVAIALDRRLARPAPGRSRAPSQGSSPRADLVAWGCGAWLVAGAISALLGESPRTSLLGAHESFDGLLTAAGFAVLFLAARSGLRGPEDAARLLRLPILAALFAAAYALAQLGGLDPLRWQRLASLGAHLRPFGSLGHANHLGSYLAMALPLLVLPWLVPPARGRLAWRGMSLAAAALALPALVAAMSRAAWLGGLAGALLLCGLLARAGLRRSAAALALALTIGSAAAVGAWVAADRPVGSLLGARVASLASPSLESRVPLWAAALRMAADHPWTGVGPDCFALAFGRYRTPAYVAREGDLTPTRAHAELLHVAATQGGLGLAAVLLGCVGALRNLRLALARGAGPREQALTAGVAASLAAFAVSVSVGFHVVATASLAALELGVLSALAGHAASAPAREGAGTRARALPRLAVAAGFLALAGAAVAAPGIVAFESWRGAELARAGRFDLARPALARVLRIAPGSDRAWALAGFVAHLEALATRDAARRRHLLVEARDAAARAVALEPADAHHRLGLARLQAELVHLDPPAATPAAVFEAVDAALARDPASPGLLASALELALALGDAERAAEIAARRRALYGG